MTDQVPADAQAEVVVNADPHAVYALITDLTSLASLAEEVQTMKWRKGDAARPGAVFRGLNRNGLYRWSTVCTVTDAHPGRTFAFDVKTGGVIPVARWRYDIEPVDGGCKVTERTWDRRPGWIVKPSRLTTGVKDRTSANVEHIKLTLQRLKKKAEG
ncbi:polyketide cyclase [Mycobacterium sp. ACS1612]|uniref:SRPBCC family protein n=1 Tax=Mycobacterium sp. ACS1612 TaxID=1834117 RepID=UPI0007FF9660|nr:SRPBCC family protein [Mycobacterium sp. ACS1612]OBF40625.1 polyketide cyclase [Mycobacterium sp. ACS1612]